MNVETMEIIYGMVGKSGYFRAPYITVNVISPTENAAHSGKKPRIT
jgi:hypothetical protein